MTDIDTSLTSSASVGWPGSPIVFSLEVKNEGTTSVIVDRSCTADDGHFEVVNEAGEPVYVLQPCYRPLCAAWSGPFAPGETALFTLAVDGRAWSSAFEAEPCPSHDLPPGQYTVVATFSYGVGAMEASVEKRVAVEWLEGPPN